MHSKTKEIDPEIQKDDVREKLFSARLYMRKLILWSPNRLNFASKSVHRMTWKQARKDIEISRPSAQKTFKEGTEIDRTTMKT